MPQISPDGRFLELALPSGRKTSLFADWLWDNLPQHRDEFSGQRLFDLWNIPPDLRFQAAAIEGDHLVVSWVHQFESDRVLLGWLEQQCIPYGDLPRTLWSRTPGQRSSLVDSLIDFGIAFAHGIPCVDGEVERFSTRFGVIYETNYGRYYDVRYQPKPENLADSEMALGLHTDNPYREPVPGYQALLFLETTEYGGESRFADGFAVAEALRESHPEAFAILTSTLVPFHFRSSNADLFAQRPFIEIDGTGRVKAIHYNPRSIAAVRLEAPAMERFYAAWRAFLDLLSAAEWEFRVLMAPGDYVIFDNHRILHGRSAFPPHQPRHLQGCYLTRDSILSRWRMEAAGRF